MLKVNYCQAHFIKKRTIWFTINPFRPKVLKNRRKLFNNNLYDLYVFSRSSASIPHSRRPDFPLRATGWPRQTCLGRILAYVAAGLVPDSDRGCDLPPKPTFPLPFPFVVSGLCTRHFPNFPLAIFSKWFILPKWMTTSLNDSQNGQEPCRRSRAMFLSIAKEAREVSTSP